MYVCVSRRHVQCLNPMMGRSTDCNKHTTSDRGGREDSTTEVSPSPKVSVWNDKNLIQSFYKKTLEEKEEETQEEIQAIINVPMPRPNHGIHKQRAPWTYSCWCDCPHRPWSRPHFHQCNRSVCVNQQMVYRRKEVRIKIKEMKTNRKSDEMLDWRVFLWLDDDDDDEAMFFLDNHPALLMELHTSIASRIWASTKWPIRACWTDVW